MGLALLAACSPIRLLAPGQRLLGEVKIVGAKTADKERLLPFARQQPNVKFPIPKLAVYQFGHSFYDSARIQRKLRAVQKTYAQRMQAAGTDSAQLGKLLTRRDRLVKRKQRSLDKGNAVMRLGEPPVIYDSARTRESVSQMNIFLHSQGFFRATVAATDTAQTQHGLWRGALYALHLQHHHPHHDSTGAVQPHRRVSVTYHVTEGQPFTYTVLRQQIPDSALAAVVRADSAHTLLRRGDRYNEETIGQERTRLEALLKNHGYFDFRAQYITLEADTSFAPFSVRLRLAIANPPEAGWHHQVYRLRRVRMVTDAGADRTLRLATSDTLRRAGSVPLNQPLNGPARLRPLRTDTTTTDSVQFAAYKLAYNTRILARKIDLRPGQLYSQARTQSTQRQLSNLDMFRFNTLNYRKILPDSAAQEVAVAPLDAVINASPASRFTETTEFGGTYVANLPGPFVNVRLKTRNPFGGAETLELSGRVGIEGQFNRVTGRDEYTTQFGGTLALVLPQFLLPQAFNNYFARLNPKTRFSLSNTYVRRPEYTRTNVEFAFDYLWQPSPYHQYVISPVVINVVNASGISDSFQRSLDRLRTQGSPLFRSFTQLFEPSFSATSLYNSNDVNQTRNARYLRLFFEAGGLTKGAYVDQNNQFLGLHVYNFAKFTADFRRYLKLSPRTYFVYRFNGGIVHALTRTDTDGGSAYTLPYDKYLFGGGSSSLRAWQPRRLGPGGYVTTLPGGTARDYFSEQPGELLLEGSVEYRFPVYSFVKGALFTDYGNVWALSQELDKDNQPVPREGARFNGREFLGQIAVGSGVGIRFDFSFLILRLDIAAKVYDPAALNESKWAIQYFYKDKEHQPAFNVGIGYPF